MAWFHLCKEKVYIHTIYTCLYRENSWKGAKETLGNKSLQGLDWGVCQEKKGRDFPGGPECRLRLCAPNAGDLDLIPGQGTGSLMHAATRDLRSLHATTKNQGSLNKYVYLKERERKGAYFSFSILLYWVFATNMYYFYISINLGEYITEWAGKQIKKYFPNSFTLPLGGNLNPFQRKNNPLWSCSCSILPSQLLPPPSHARSVFQSHQTSSSSNRTRILLPPSFAKCCFFCLEHSPCQPLVL